MSQTPKKPYNKPWMSFGDQVKKLQSRGLVVSDPSAAAEFLSHVNYYRFSGYCLAFNKSPHQFVPNTTFEQIQFAYEFDTSLRSLVGDWLQLAELDLRTQTAHLFAEKYGPFGHLDAANFATPFSRRVTQAKWLARLQKDTQQSDQEKFVKHFKINYTQFPDLPIWTAVEVMTFGSLSRMIGGMKQSDRLPLAASYGIDVAVFASIVLHLSYVRNVCAHHSRLWERLHQMKPKLPTTPEWRSPLLTDNGRLFCTLLLLRQVTQRTASNKATSDRYRDKVAKLLRNPPTVPRPDVRMGLPANWQQHPVWC